ncbi:terpenoid synthase [Coniophora puteana RWD-64-598 SS2]|uniref:Terpene synthase n=1 Tax=Coniophora puteana (strain RWD-64-598) TaxID=741705 RepID=A0A5M3MYJ1_CONPW|nr:terpenoid synthase [Coniophora puteana RWD-64-598 SS2]EIW84218.1 terpenoid synthase [Coniophora puteana RWD-64-598 SS2]
MSATPAPTEFILPNLFSVCPLTFGRSNPYYDEVIPEARAWIAKYNPFVDSKRAEFVQGCNELLCSRVWPYAGREEFRTCCDFVNLLFVLDELSDDMGGADARSTCDSFIRVLNDPDAPDTSLIAQMTREFRARVAERAKPGCLRRFIALCGTYVEAVCVEAELREQGRVLDLRSFILLRRENSAVRCCLALAEYALGLELPDAVFNDPAFQSVYFCAADMVCWSNDVYSYNMEQAKGHTGNNVVTVLMQEHGIDLQAAADRVGEVFGQLMEHYTSGSRSLPTWGGKVDADAARFLEAAGQWVVGNLEWSFETPRYFGPDHDEVRDTHRVLLK